MLKYNRPVLKKHFSETIKGTSHVRHVHLAPVQVVGRSMSQLILIEWGWEPGGGESARWLIFLVPSCIQRIGGACHINQRHQHIHVHVLHD